MKFYHKKAFLFILILFAVANVSAQDLIAKQAPVDRHLKAVDSLTLQHLIKKDNLESPASDLYETWNTNYLHCYAESSIPDSFRINLRHFAMPTPSRIITSHFGYRPAFHRFHKGLDIKVYTGDTIYAAFAGKVRVVKYDAGGFGNYIVIRHYNGLETVYGHLSKQLVTTDQLVKAGEPIGLGGSTGRSTGSHLHFETRLMGVAINPELIFNFPEQDITGNYFVFYKTPRDGSHLLLASNKEETHEYHPKEKKAAEENYAIEGKIYQVKAGETLYSISQKLNIPLNFLRKINKISKNFKLRPSQILHY